MAGRIPVLRAAAVMTAAALGVHELRYLIGYGGDAGSTLAAQGHGYLAFAAAGTAALLAAAVSGLLAAMARVHRTGERDIGGLPFGLLWLSASIGLALVYCGQELLEGVLAPGHPVGLAGVIATGGWTAFPLSFALGLVVALLLRGADAAIAAVARRRVAPDAPARAAGPLRPPRPVLAPPASVLALNLAGRAPPAAS
jgi:hypothetical protein